MKLTFISIGLLFVLLTGCGTTASLDLDYKELPKITIIDNNNETFKGTLLEETETSLTVYLDDFATTLDFDKNQIKDFKIEKSSTVVSNEEKRMAMQRDIVINSNYTARSTSFIAILEIINIIGSIVALIFLSK